jgi:hypothetical protein
MSTFEKALGANLREQEQALDAATLSRISAVRRHALAIPSRPWWRSSMPAFGGAVLATLVGIAVLLPMQQMSQEPGVPVQRVVENPDFYSDLDFYLWLADSELGGNG